jgi:hypothetical protein
MCYGWCTPKRACASRRRPSRRRTCTDTLVLRRRSGIRPQYEPDSRSLRGHRSAAFPPRLSSFPPLLLGTSQGEDPVDNKKTIYPWGVYGKDLLMKWRSAKAAG